MKKITTLILLLTLVLLAAPVFAGDGPDAAATTTATGGGSDYQSNMKRDLVRGFKNVIGSPLEVPITIQEYHGKAGRPVIRHMAGLIDGLFQGVVRLGSGAWDFVAAFLPGHQEGMPVDPETLF